MNNGVINLLDMAKKKMGGFAALLNYRFQNLSVKAQPEALLSFTANVGGQEKPVEDVAQARLTRGRDDQFELFPLHSSYLLPIVKGLKLAHPEYKIEVQQPEGSEDPDDAYLTVTMPEMDDSRHDLLMDVVGTLSDACKTEIDAVVTYYTAQISLKLATAAPDEQKEAADALKDLHDKHEDLCKQYRADKEKEIEDAYQKYLSEKASAQESQEKEKADKNAGTSMQMNWKLMDE